MERLLLSLEEDDEILAAWVEEAERASNRVAEAFLQDVPHTCQCLIAHPEIGPAIPKRLRTLPIRQ